MTASKAVLDAAGKVDLSGVATAARCASTVDHEPDQTVEKLRRTRSCGEASAYSARLAQGDRQTLRRDSATRRACVDGEWWSGLRSGEPQISRRRYPGHASIHVRARLACWEKVAAAVPPGLGAACTPSAPSPSTAMESIRPALASIRLSAPKRAYRPLYQCLHTSAARGATPLPHPSGRRHDVAKMVQQLTSDSTRTTACDARAAAIRCI